MSQASESLVGIVAHGWSQGEVFGCLFGGRCLFCLCFFLPVCPIVFIPCPVFQWVNDFKDILPFNAPLQPLLHFILWMI